MEGKLGRWEKAAGWPPASCWFGLEPPPPPFLGRGPLGKALPLTHTDTCTLTLDARMCVVGGEGQLAGGTFRGSKGGEGRTHPGFF